MDRPISQPLQVLFRACLELAEVRADVREALHALRAWLNDHLPGPTQGDGAHSLEVRESATGFDAAFDKVLAPGPDRRVLSLRASENGDAHADRRLRERPPPDLNLIVRRARWKADAVRWAVERRKLEAASADHATAIRPREDELRARREELEECFAWMLDPYRRLPEDERMLQIADSYENVAIAAETTLALIAAGALEPSPPPDLLYQLAEAQSALLAALAAVDLRSDSDQRDLFVWLKNQTLRHRIYVDRHMKLDDPADFRDAAGRRERLRRLAASLLERKLQMRRRVHLLNKVRFHLRKLVESDGQFGSDLESIGQAVDEWKEAGYPLNDRHLVDMLANLAENVSGDAPMPPSVAEVLATRAADPAECEGVDPQRARREAAVRRASELVRGMRALVLAGAGDEEASRALERDLGLGEVRWVALGAEPDAEALETALSAPDADLVLLAVRLPETAYAEFKRHCRERNAPFVRLPGGLGAPEVAQQLLRQIGRMLQGRVATRA